LKPNQGDPVGTLFGHSRCFDALSFYICLARRQLQKTFASIPQTYGVKKLNDQQLAAHESELARHARFVCRKYEIDRGTLYKFLVFLLRLQSKYQDEERTKLANELESDIMFLAEFIWGVTGQTSAEVEECLGKCDTIWTQRQFRHLDKSLQISPENALTQSYKALTLLAMDKIEEAYKLLKGRVNLTNPKFQSRLLVLCESFLFRANKPSRSLEENILERKA
jgi:hypothetical protein